MRHSCLLQSSFLRRQESRGAAKWGIPITNHPSASSPRRRGDSRIARPAIAGPPDTATLRTTRHLHYLPLMERHIRKLNQSVNFETHANFSVGHSALGDSLAIRMGVSCEKTSRVVAEMCRMDTVLRHVVFPTVNGRAATLGTLALTGEPSVATAVPRVKTHDGLRPSIRVNAFPLVCARRTLIHSLCSSHCGYLSCEGSP